MLQSLLAEPFRLTLHRESRTVPAYRLVVAKEGAKIEESQAGGDLVMSETKDGRVFRNVEMMRLSGYLSSQVDRVVIEETGLKGFYNFVLKKPEDAPPDQPRVKSDGMSPDSPSAGIFAKALKQLGFN
jgi:uncharacterized protein (TIGR03435 family)